MFKVHLNLSYRQASLLKKDQLPIEPITIFSETVDDKKVEVLQEVVNSFNSRGDTILYEIFSQFCDDRIFEFDLIYTTGVQAPYDAWTALSDHGKPIMYFNLSEWTTEQLAKDGLAVVIHEVTHALLEPLLINYESTDHLMMLERIIIDEGMAHFLGFPGNRLSLVEKYHDKWIQSESELEAAIKNLDSRILSEAEINKLLLKSNTGPFWEKYAAISGMFRAAKIHSTKGTDGIIKAIKEGRLPTFKV